MKRVLFILLASAFLLMADAQNLLPVRDSIGKLTISVDPRMELLGAVQTVAGYPLSTCDTPYSDQVQAFFGAFADSDVAKFTKKLFESGFSYDAPPGLMLYYSCPLELKQLQPYSNYLKGRGNGVKNLRKYRIALKRFALKSRFFDFWKKNEDSYRQFLTQFKHEVIRDIDVVGLLEAYFNMKQTSCEVILCPLFGDFNYGPRIPDPNGGFRTYALMAVSQSENGAMSLDHDRLLEVLLHEFGHSFINPVVDLHSDLVAQSSDRYESIREKMMSKAYTSWNICVYEHLVRAAVIRLIETIRGPKAAKNLISYEERQYFGYIRPLVEKLREYEVLRDSEGITFADYVPELLKVFNEAEFYKPCFQGTVNAVLLGADVICVHPTVGNAAADATRYVSGLVDWVNDNWSSYNTRWRLIADSVAVKMPLDNCNIVCYGTVENNLLLAKYRSKLPFRVEPGAIVADRRYDDPEVRLIACMPNPENPELGMAVYTAIDERRIIDINNVSHGPDDFCIFTDCDHILSHGYFEKRGTEWRFPWPEPLAE